MVGEEFAHQLQTGTGTLQRGRDVDEGVHERRRERVRQPERLRVRACRALLRAEQGVPDLGADPPGLLEGRLDEPLRLGVPRLEDARVGDLREVAVLQGDLVEPAGGQVQGVLDGGFRRAGHLFADEFTQVALAGDERHDGDGASGVTALHEVRDLAGLAGHELLLMDEGGEPEDQLVQEQDQSVVAERLGVLGDDGQTGVQGDEAVLVLGGVPGEAGEEVGAGVVDQLGAQLGRGGGVAEVERGAPLVVLLGGEGGVEELRGPAEALTPLVRFTVARVAAAQAPDDRLVTVGGTVGADVGEEGVGPVHLRGRGVRVQLLDVRDVPAEHPLFEGLCAEHVVRHEQEPLAVRGQPLVLGQHRVELGTGAGGRVAAEQRVEHGHEVRLTGTERAVQVGRLGAVPVERGLDERQRLVEVLQQPLGDDVVLERVLGALGCRRLGEGQHEVRGGDVLLDVYDIAEEGRLLGHYRSRSPSGGLCRRLYPIVRDAS